jgi:hypothetical protein
MRLPGAKPSTRSTELFLPSAPFDRGIHNTIVISAAQSEALDRARGLPASASNLERVARVTNPEAARWAFTQWSLRTQARRKFALADQMLFTREALEQATNEKIAAYHAARFPKEATVADLTAGIGADLIALAARGPAIGYETDEERARYAQHNLAVHGLDAEIRLQSCLDGCWEFRYALADPARRSAGRRTLDPDAFQPNPALLKDRMMGLDLGLMKLTPMLPDLFLDSLSPSRTFLSLRRECPEALLAFGGKMAPGQTAVQVETQDMLDSSGADFEHRSDPLSYFFEADPAAIRAGCLPTLASRYELALLGDSNGYLTGATPVDSSWMTCYRVLACHSADIARTKRVLEELDAATPEVKSRAGIDVLGLQKLLKRQGKRHLFVAVYPVGKSLRHSVLEALSL